MPAAVMLALVLVEPSSPKSLVSASSPSLNLCSHRGPAVSPSARAPLECSYLAGKRHRESFIHSTHVQLGERRSYAHSARIASCGVLNPCATSTSRLITFSVFSYASQFFRFMIEPFILFVPRGADALICACNALLNLCTSFLADVQGSPSTDVLACSDTRTLVSAVSVLFPHRCRHCLRLFPTPKVCDKPPLTVNYSHLAFRGRAAKKTERI